MTAAQILREAEGMGVILRIEGGKLRFTAPAGIMSDDLRARLKQHRDEVLVIIIAERHGIVPADLIEAAGADWAEIDGHVDAVEALASAIRCNQHRARGQRPPEYTEPAVCVRCGPVWLFPSPEIDGKWHQPVLGCPWCHNRGARLPIPRPHEVLCGDCAHWRPDIINPADGVGACGVGVTVQGKPIAPLRWHRGRCGRFALMALAAERA